MKVEQCAVCVGYFLFNLSSYTFQTLLWYLSSFFKCCFNKVKWSSQTSCLISDLRLHSLPIMCLDGNFGLWSWGNHVFAKQWAPITQWCHATSQKNRDDTEACFWIFCVEDLFCMVLASRQWLTMKRGWWIWKKQTCIITPSGTSCIVLDQPTRCHHFYHRTGTIFSIN